jgi:thymidylate synthase (FAD)
MHIVQPTFEIYDANRVMRNIERGARICYKSEDKIGPGSDAAIIEKILTPKHGIKHESVLEHGVISVIMVFDRGVSHEVVRHRVAAFSQESTRYCNYSKDKYGNRISVIAPFFFDPEEPALPVQAPTFVPDSTNKRGVAASYIMATMNSFDVWVVSMLTAEWAYTTLTGTFGRSAQEARSVLPNSLKTEMEITANVREWRHILTLRTGRDAHPQIRQVMVPLGHALAQRWPVLFGEFAAATHDCPAVETTSAA